MKSLKIAGITFYQGEDNDDDEQRAQVSPQPVVPAANRSPVLDNVTITSATPTAAGSVARPEDIDPRFKADIEQALQGCATEPYLTFFGFVEEFKGDVADERQRFALALKAAAKIHKGLNATQLLAVVAKMREALAVENKEANDAIQAQGSEKLSVAQQNLTSIQGHIKAKMDQVATLQAEIAQLQSSEKTQQSEIDSATVKIAEVQKHYAAAQHFYEAQLGAIETALKNNLSKK